MRLSILIVCLMPALAAAAVPPLPPDESLPIPASEVLVEFGGARPQGDLAADFRADELGFGAGDGFELGFRWRKYLTRRLSLAPAFHFSDYKNHNDFIEVTGNTGTTLEPFDVSATVYRYTLELGWTLRDPDETIVPFIGIGGGLYRNRVRGYYKIHEIPFDQSVNTVGWQARVGVRFMELELSFVYHLNRFSTRRFFNTGTDESYSWDTIVLRLGWAIPFS